MKKLNIIRFNDDNHAERVWADGKYIGRLSDIDSLIEFLLDVINDDYSTTKELFEGIESTSIWVCDDFDDLDEELVDDIWDWFNNVDLMTEEQIEMVKNRDWEGLQKIID